jgi:quaternary ammonium compound-resistance protein SugE
MSHVVSREDDLAFHERLGEDGLAQRGWLMAWILLIFAGILEIGWAIGLKYTDGFTRLWPSVWTILAMVVSMYLLALAARALPIGTAYAVWVGIGAAGTAILGMYLFSEPRDVARILCIVLIVSGVVGLKILH